MARPGGWQRRSLTLFRPRLPRPMQVMEGESGRRAVEEMRSKITPALLATWTIWPLANRILFCNVISVGPDMVACRQLVYPTFEKQLGGDECREVCGECAHVMGPLHNTHIIHVPHTTHSAGGLHILSVPHPSQEAIRI